MPRGLGGRNAALPAVGVLLLTFSLVSPLGGASVGATSAARPAASAPAVDQRYLTRRPPVGAIWVLDINGFSTAQRLLARSLQGLVNRSEVRLYIVDGNGQAGLAEQNWLSRYQQQEGVTVAGSLDLPGALAMFHTEVAGYVLADESEPWTIDAAASYGARDRGVVATPDTVPALDAAGIALQRDLRRRWSTAAAAYLTLAAEVWSGLDSPSLAVLRPGDSLWDFTAEQGILTVFARPGDDAWAVVASLIRRVPAGHAIYGYVADTGDQEATALIAISAAGNWLVPTDTTANLSVHVAIGGGRAGLKVPDPPGNVQPCSKDQVNVVVVVSDGDNVALAEHRYVQPDYWTSPQRGSVPLGWSLPPELATLAPAMWDRYASEVAPSDELVGMAGLGYVYPIVAPDPTAVYRATFAQFADVNMRTFWSLGGLLASPDSAAWTALETAAADEGTPQAVVVDYGGNPYSAAKRPSGIAALVPGNTYVDDPNAIASMIEALRNETPDQRPLVTAYMASVWSNTATGLYAALGPLKDAGVRFLTPSEAAACLPGAPVAPPPTITPSTRPTTAPPTVDFAVATPVAAVPQYAG